MEIPRETAIQTVMITHANSLYNITIVQNTIKDILSFFVLSILNKSNQGSSDNRHVKDNIFIIFYLKIFKTKTNHLLII